MKNKLKFKEMETEMDIYKIIAEELNITGKVMAGGGCCAVNR